MTIDWGGYRPYVPSVIGPLHTLSRSDARAEFTKLMAEKSERIDMLRQFLASCGVHLTYDDAGIQRLNDWFRTNLEPSDTEPGRLGNLWYAIVNDISLFLGDVIIARCPGVKWVFFVSGARNISFQRHVLMGFAGVPNPKYNVDVDRVVATYGHRIIGGAEVEQDMFVSMVHSAAARAG